MNTPRGFHPLSASARPWTRGDGARAALLGWLCGLLLAQAWVVVAQQDLEDLQRQQSQLQAELARAQTARAQAVELDRRAQAGREQRSRMQAAQQHWRHCLDLLEDLAHSTGARVLQFRLDGQGLQLQAEMDPARLQAWVAARPAASWGLAGPQIVEAAAQPRSEGVALARWVLRWPLQAAERAP